MKNVKTLILALGLGSILPLAAQTTVTFDELGAQPADFADANQLTTQYHSLGLTFSGGGAILDVNANFGVGTVSGRDYLAFNSFSQNADGSIPSGPETVTFATPVSSVSIFAGDGDPLNYSLGGFDASGVLLASDTETGVGGQYVELTISAPGITSIQFGSDDGAAFVFDNLTFTESTAPVPDGGSTMFALGFGMIGLMLARRMWRFRQIA